LFDFKVDRLVRFLDVRREHALAFAMVAIKAEEIKYRNQAILVFAGGGRAYCWGEQEEKSGERGGFDDKVG
jgi:hypothetical protein